MDHAAVVPGLVPAEAVLLLQEDDAGPAVARRQLQRGRQSDDAAADDAVLIIHRPACVPAAWGPPRRADQISASSAGIILRFISRRMSGVRMAIRSEEHTSELQSLMRISYAVFCLKKKN